MGKNIDAPKVHVYYGWFAGVFNALQADELVALIVDREEVWRPTTSIKRATSANPYVADVPKYGRFHFYWGTSDQTLTSAHQAFMTGHSNYRDRVLMFFENWKCGRERTSIPNVEIIIRRSGQQSVVTNASAALDGDGQANPIVAIAEAWTHPIVGAGRPIASIDLPTWQAVADDLASDKALNYLTVSESGETTLREVISQVLDHIDGYGRWTPEGKYAIGRFLQVGPAPSGLQVITIDQLEDEPEVDGVSLDEAPNYIEVTFRNRELDFKESTTRYDNQYARRRRGGVIQKERFERPYIRRYAQAQAATPRLGRTVSQFYHQGSIEIAAALVENLQPGDNFILHLPEYNMYQEVVRLIQREGDDTDSETITIDWETERNISALGASPVDEIELDAAPDTVIDFEYWQPVMLPPQLTGETYRIAALAGRTNGLTTSARLWMRYGSVDEYFQLGQQRNFAYPCKLADAYADTEALDDTTGNLKIELFTDPDPEPVGFGTINTTQSSEAIADDTLLMFVFDASDQTLYEIMTIQAITSPTAGVYPVHVMRARFGTARRTFTSGARAFIINRAVLSPYAHRQFPTIAAESLAADREVELKLQPISASESLPLDDCTSTTLELSPQSTALSAIGDIDVSGLPETISATPTQSEVQSILDVLNATVATTITTRTRLETAGIVQEYIAP